MMIEIGRGRVGVEPGPQQWSNWRGPGAFAFCNFVHFEFGIEK